MSKSFHQFSEKMSQSFLPYLKTLVPLIAYLFCSPMQIEGKRNEHTASEHQGSTVRFTGARLHLAAL